MPAEEQPKCPVDHSTRETWVKNLAKEGENSQAGSTGGLPPNHPPTQQNGEQQVCPVDHDTRKVWLQKTSGDTVPEAIECSSDQLPVEPQYNTNVKLPVEREISSIPRTGSGSHWVYPSQKQFYEAMLRKKWDPAADDMKTVVPIHNSVNERVWSYINFWEKNEGGESCGGIQLSSFKGDAKKLTPRAWFRSSILGYSKPFDRHDWTVNRCGKELEYVIDFYSDDNAKTGPNIYLDVRPKLNSFEGIRLRIKKAFGW